MKHFVAFLVSVLLVACGGGDETPVAVIKASAPRPAANAATVSGGSGIAVHMYQALYGMAPSNEMLLNSTAQATADPSTFARNLTSNFASTSSTALAKLVLDNLGVTATTVTAMNGQGLSEYAILLDALGQMFTFYGADARGQIILNATNLLTGLESDATYGTTAIAYNNQTAANFNYSSDPASTSAAAVSTSTATVGAAQSVDVGTLVTLDGSASTAGVGKSITYLWTLTSKPNGSSATLSSTTIIKPTFTADVAGMYVASLTVNDGNANSKPSITSINATALATPITFKERFNSLLELFSKSPYETTATFTSRVQSELAAQKTYRVISTAHTFESMTVAYDADRQIANVKFFNGCLQRNVVVCTVVNAVVMSVDGHAFSMISMRKPAANISQGIELNLPIADAADFVANDRIIVDFKMDANLPIDTNTVKEITTIDFYYPYSYFKINANISKLTFISSITGKTYSYTF